MKSCWLVFALCCLIVPVVGEVAKLQPTTRTIPLYKQKYQELKKSLKILGEDLTPTEVLEVVAVRYAEMFDKAQENFLALDRRIVTLESDVADVKQLLLQTVARVEKAEESLQAQSDDLDKLFNWTAKIDDELYDGMAYGPGGSIKGRVLQNARGVEGNATDIKSIKEDLKNHARAINALDSAVRSINMRR